MSHLATENSSSSSYSSSRFPSRQISTARSSSPPQRNAGSKALPGNHVKWASPGSVRTLRFTFGSTPLQSKPLYSIMDLERAKTKSLEELTSVWDDLILCDSIVERKWLCYNVRSVEAPHMIFTGLKDYKARGTQAAPYLTSTFYTEFSETKDLVFIRGDVVFTSKLTDEEAKRIMETAQLFYLNDTRYKDVLQTLDMPVL